MSLPICSQMSSSTRTASCGSWIWTSWRMRFRDRLITAEQMQMALRRLDKLLSLIYKGAFPKLQKYIEDYEAMDTGN